jgi:hypothetical protein
MSSLLTIDHFIEKTNLFINEIGSSNSTYFFYTSKPDPWSNTSGSPDDTAVLQVNNSVTQVELELYDDLLFGKLLTSNDIKQVVPKYEWTSNTVYAQYDQDDSNLYSKNFYVVTTGIGDAYNVYKCIDNNSNSVSLIKPTLQNTSGNFKTGDGYVWKFMYTVDIQSNTRFTTTGYIPLTANTEVQGNSVPGTIDVIRITNTGVGYDVYESGTVDSVLNRFTIKLQSNASPIDNYYTSSSIYLKPGFGAGQVREIQSYNGTTKNIVLQDPVDNFLRLDFENSDFVTGGGEGEIVSQVIDTITFTASRGAINPGSNVVQTDTGTTAKVLSANTTTLRLSRFNTAQTISNNFILRSVSDVGVLQTDKVNISNSTGIGLTNVLQAGTGYSINATVTVVSSSGANAVLIAQSNSSGKIEQLVINAAGTGYLTEPTIIISEPVAEPVNANTDITEGTGEGANNIIALSTSTFFVANDQITYTVEAGNTAIGGLSSNTTYFIQFANSTHIALSPTANTAPGTRIALTKGSDETGHLFQGIRATGRAFPRALYAANNAANSALNVDYSAGDFIRVGENPDNNIRRVTSVNSTILFVDRIFASTLTGANTFKVPTGVLVSSVQVDQANAVITSTSLDSVRLTISDLSSPDQSFILGEKVVTTANSSDGTGIVVFSNTSTLFLSGTTGTLNVGLPIRGNSSNLTATIATVVNSPSVTVVNPNGTFVLGESVYFNTTTGSNTGFANLVNIADLSKFNIQYEIAPTVRITGDGTGAVAIATVNNQIGLANSIAKITVLNSGSNYTRANVDIVANTLYGTGASAKAIISPIGGHGSDAAQELGARFACVDMQISNSAAESWYYPSNIEFRKVGILKNPVFANTIIETSGYNSVRVFLANTSGNWTQGEIVTQSNTNAAGIVISGNTQILKLRSAVGTFLASNPILGHTSGVTSDVTGSQLISFSAGELISQPATGAIARVDSFSTNTTINLSDIKGKFSSNLNIVGLDSDASATVDSINLQDGRDLTLFYSTKFNQTSRLSLSSNTGSYQVFERVSQGNATAKVLSTDDLDLDLSISNGSFSTGDLITNSNTAATARVIHSIGDCLKLTAVSNTVLFNAGDEIQNQVGAIATVNNVKSVIVVYDVSKTDRFQVSNNVLVIGENTGSTGIISCNVPPDLLRESGKAIYMESSNNVITKDINTTERVRLVIKF